MWSKIKQNGREITGWVAILFFVFAYLIHADNLHPYSDQQTAYGWLALDLVILVLAWLWLNRKPR